MGNLSPLEFALRRHLPPPCPRATRRCPPAHPLRRRGSDWKPGRRSVDRWSAGAVKLEDHSCWPSCLLVSTQLKVEVNQPTIPHINQHTIPHTRENGKCLEPQVNLVLSTINIKHRNLTINDMFMLMLNIHYQIDLLVNMCVWHYHS